jgi:pimeloyl-ACP methyl ester carboxylesterase
MAADAHAVLDAAGETSAHVFGLSLGGLVAQELAITQPDRLRSLMLCGTVVGGVEAVWADQSVLDMLQANASLPLEQAVRASIPVAYAEGTDRARIDEDVARRIELPTSREGYLAQLMGSAMYPGTRSRLPGVHIPALVVTGETDKIAPPANAAIIAGALPDARVLVVQGAGHMVITDQPEVLAAAMASFISEVQVSVSRSG